MTVGERIRKSDISLANEAVYYINYIKVWVGLNGIVGLTHDEVVASNLEYLRKTI